MADRLGISQQQMADLARSGEPTKISSMCTVFAESEVISLIGRGEPRENIARGVIDSVVSRVATMAGQAAGAPYYLTGGLCENAFVVERLGELLGSPVTTSPQARHKNQIALAAAPTLPRSYASRSRRGIAPPCFAARHRVIPKASWTGVLPCLPYRSSRPSCRFPSVACPMSCPIPPHAIVI